MYFLFSTIQSVLILHPHLALTTTELIAGYMEVQYQVYAPGVAETHKHILMVFL